MSDNGAEFFDAHGQGRGAKFSISNGPYDHLDEAQGRSDSRVFPADAIGRFDDDGLPAGTSPSRAEAVPPPSYSTKSGT